MTVRGRILRGRYVDSVVLMNLASRLTTFDGIEDAAAMMATDANKTVLAEGGFAFGDVTSAGADDLAIAVKAVDEAAAERALAQVEQLLSSTPSSNDEASSPSAGTLDDALAANPELNLAAISLPGEYAATEARAALERGLHVVLFSSNVTLDDEVALKRLATDRGLLCMGPDCGTAIIAGKGLGFANAVRRGPVGIVGASGTGIQALSCLLDSAGVGISHAIGCGSRDLSGAVAARTTTAALTALLADDETRVIVVVSKPPSAALAAGLRTRAEQAAKPVVCCFLDETTPTTLDDAAAAAIAALGDTMPLLGSPLSGGTIEELKTRLAPEQRFIRGLYAGGTLAYEAQLVLRDAGLEVASNAPLPGGQRVEGDARSEGHVILDLGAEEFTRGRPHPMIDARARRQRLHEEAEDPRVAVIVLDFVLGYGAAKDPAGDLAADIAVARTSAARNGRELIVLAVVYGTDRDPQGLSTQRQALKDAGALLVPSNAAAARSAALIVADVTARELVGAAP